MNEQGNDRNSHQENNLLIYGYYTEIIDEIKHMDLLQNFDRTLASKCLLATFGGIGFILSLKLTILPFSPLIIVIFICFISSCAVLSLWYSDLLCKERLLIGAIAEALRLENKYPWLPQTHHNMIKKNSHHGSPAKKVLFYIGCISSLILFGGIISMHFFSHLNIYFHLIFAILILFITAISGFSLYKITGSFDKLLKIALKKSKRVHNYGIK